MDDLISRLSEIRSKYNCFDESEEPYYRALSEAIKLLSRQADDDLVSREAVKKWLERWDGYIDMDIIRRMQYRVIDIPSAQPEWNNHTVACLLEELFDDTCACNFNDIDEWLPEKCELLDSCPNPGGVACWEQFLKHKAERRTDERFNQQTGG